MSEFKDVTIVKKANIYFNGNVTSRTVIFTDGSKKTLGVMLPGDYEFNTGDREIMEILTGELDVLLPGQTSWQPNIKLSCKDLHYLSIASVELIIPG